MGGRGGKTAGWINQRNQGRPWKTCLKKADRGRVSLIGGRTTSAREENNEEVAAGRDLIEGKFEGGGGNEKVRGRGGVEG